MEEPIKRTTLPNGIRIITQAVPSVYSVAIGFWIKAGSGDETKEESGLAHLLEHMTFKGTKHRKNSFEISNEIESLGGIINAYTSRNCTCYFTHILYEHISKGVEILSDLIQYPLLPENELEKEKKVIIEEIRELEDEPHSAIHDYFDRQIFPNHPIGRPIQGTIESVSAFTRDDLIRFRNNFYTADRLIIVAVGRLNHDELVELVNKYCVDLPLKSIQRKHPELPPVEQKKAVVYKDVSQAHLVFGRRIFPRSDPRRIPLLLLNTILSGGMSSRFFQNIRDKYGGVYEIYSFTDLDKEAGVFGVYAGVQPERIEEIKGLVFKELDDLSKNGLSEEEFKKVKEQVKGALVISLESMYSRMSRLATSAIFEKSALTIQKALERINKVTIDEIHALVSYLNNQDEFVETIFLPKN